ncbi:MAG: AAA family ATPase, partial [Desulfovibrio sp.]|nr:AAA family ATPase [Desulfovibrio sp.]
MSHINIKIGCESFRDMRINNYCYVDKTQLLEEMLCNCPPVASLITRPRRFGKTLNMSMLDEFFDINKNSIEIFQDLNISRNKSVCQEWMNQYPTLFITFKGLEAKNFDNAYLLYRKLISNICRDNKYLLKGDAVDKVDKDFIDRVLTRTDDYADMVESLKTLSHALQTYWQKQVILLIDEYDAPIYYAEQNCYYQDMIQFIRSVLGAVLKTNPLLKFAVLTGCLRIAKESIFTGLNNFKCFGISDSRFADKFGFTVNEVERLLKDANLSEKKDVIQEWYDGYRFGQEGEIYCPWDVLQYIDDLQDDPEKQPKAYWNNTSKNAIVRTLVNQANEETRSKVEKLISGEAITVDLVEDLTYDTVYNDENNIWSVMYETGYLTKDASLTQHSKSSLVIPNKEVRQIFTQTVSQWFRETLKKQDFRLFIEAFWSGDSKAVQETLTDILYSTISYYDSVENYYHGFMTGLLHGAGFNVKSNREKGLGRPDIVIEDLRKRRAILIEVKSAKRYEELEKYACAALQQIEERNYAAGLEVQIQNIMKYGIAFWKKECFVK